MFRISYLFGSIRADFDGDGRDFGSAEMIVKHENRGAAPFGLGNT